MNTISDPQRRPVYFDRSNNRFLLEPVGSGPWPVVTIEPATAVSLESLGSYPANIWIGRIGSTGSLQSYGPDNLIDLINVASVSQIDSIRVAPATTSGTGVVRLTDGVTSTSTTTAATPNSVKTAYDLAASADSTAAAAAAAASSAESVANAASSTASSASSTANTALSTANAASLAAANVLGIANNALSVANSAQATSSEAQSTANAASSTATSAASDASSAIVTANSALSLANSVQTTASTAQSTADSALSTATSAQSTASTALSTATSAESTANAISATANAAVATANSAQATATAAQAAVSAALPSAGGTMTGALLIGPSGSLLFEGSTNNDFETTLAVVDPTADHTITLPNATGTVALLNQAQTFSGANSFVNATGHAFRQGAATDGILLRGSASGSSGYSVEIAPASLSASRTLTAPNVSGTIITTSDTGTVTNTMLAGSIATNKLASSTISGVSLGGNLNALTLGTGLSGTSYNGSSAVTAAVSYGTTAGTACQGNDARLSDARNTANVLTFNNGGSGAASGTTFNGSVAQTISFNTIGAAASSHGHGNISSGGAIGSTANLPIITTTSGLLTTGAFGAAANTFCQGNDARLSDTRNTTNALTFNNSGSGVASGTTFNGSAARTISYNSIGAAPTSSPSFTGTGSFSGACSFGDVTTGNNVTTGDTSVRVGANRTGTGGAYIDLITVSGAGYNFRAYRGGDTNGELFLQQAGTGDVSLSLNGSAIARINQNRFCWFNGGVIASNRTALWGGLIQGSTNASYHECEAKVHSGVTSTAVAYNSSVTTDNAPSAVTVADLIHFRAQGDTKGTNTTINNQYGFFASASLTAATNDYGFYGNLPNGANNFNFYGGSDAQNYFAGTVASLGSYNSTTSSAANVFITSAGLLQRSTSSIRYKTQIEDLEAERSEAVILGARPVWYRSLCDSDNPEWSWYGLIAEEVAEIDPRLVFWGRPTKRVLIEEAADAVLDETGEVLEPAREAVYTNVEDTEAPLRPEGVQYDRLTVMLIDVVQRQQEALEALRARVQELEEHVA
jgi:hypothetical protein